MRAKDTYSSDDNLDEKINNFHDARKQADYYLKELHYTNRAVEYFNELLPLLPDPNDTNLWEKPETLDAVRHHLCQRNEQGVYQYAILPVVAAGVAIEYSDNKKEYLCLIGMFNGAPWSQMRQDIFRWNDFNPYRQGLSKYKFALKWLWHVLAYEDDDLLPGGVPLMRV